MIYPTTQIQYMDVKEEKVETCTIESFFTKYFYRAEVHHGGFHQIHCERHMMDIKIRDNTGWTDIRYVNMVPNKEWMRIYSGGKSIIITPYTFLPTYDDQHPESGFHGEIKYQYTLMHPEKVCENEAKIRVINGYQNDEEVEFDKVIIDYLYSKKLNIKPPYTIGYDIVTKSRFFNANDIYLFGSEELTFEEYDKWNQKDKKS